jgi:hypothetical protein
MPIVISEFEIVPETEPARPAAPPAPAAGRRLTPHEIALALRHEAERMARVRAD